MDFPALLASLTSFPAVLEATARSWTNADAHWKPAPDKWCLCEILGHLLDEELDDFGARVRSTLHDPAAAWAAIDPEAAVRERGYASADHRALFERWHAARTQSVHWLGKQAAADWSLAHEHPSFGALSAGELLAAWVAHDSLHWRQIANLNVQKTQRDAAPFSTRYAG
jgi:hypothetical protein